MSRLRFDAKRIVQEKQGGGIQGFKDPRETENGLYLRGPEGPRYGKVIRYRYAPYA
jgi:hypothetical protein